MLQLLSDSICVILIRSAAGKSQYIKYTTNTFEQEYGFPVSDFIAYKSILGDSSDNIPGVPGIGEKTAYELVQTYHKDVQISDIFVHPYDESKLYPLLSSLDLQSLCTSKSKHKKLF